MEFLTDFDYPPTMTDLYAPEKESSLIRNAFKYSKTAPLSDQWSVSTTELSFAPEPANSNSSSSPVVDDPAVWNQFVESILSNEPIELTTHVELSPEKRGRKRKLSEKSEIEALELKPELNDYRQKRIRNNIAVRKSRKRSKLRAEKINSKLIELVAESDKLQEMIAHIQQQSLVYESKAKTAERQIDETEKSNIQIRHFITSLPSDMQPCFSF